jgi:hypothetical protein
MERISPLPRLMQQDLRVPKQVIIIPVEQGNSFGAPESFNIHSIVTETAKLIGFYLTQVF